MSSTKDVISFPFGLDDLNEVFEIMNLLDNNRDELIAKFKPAVTKYLERAKYFPPGIMRLEHKRAFPDLIISLIRKEVEDHFNFNPEQILMLTQKDIIDMLTEGYYFDERNYE